MKKSTEQTTATKKQTAEQKTTEKKQSRAEATEQKRTALEAELKKQGYTFRASQNDIEKKKRLFVIAGEKTICSITYSPKGDTVRVKSSTKYNGAEYHEGWALAYSSEVNYKTELATVLNDITDIRAKQKAEAEAKKAEKKQKKAEAEKQTEQKQKPAPKAEKQTASKPAPKQRKATAADLQKKATAKK